MSPHHLGGPRPNSRRPIYARQLTIGECAAIARYGPHFADDTRGTVSIDQLMELLDRMEVCTTCGWPVHTHGLEPYLLKALTCCGQYVRD